MSRTKPPGLALAAALAPLPFTPAEVALIIAYTKVTIPADPQPAGAGWQITVATALIDRLARTDANAAALLRPMLAFASVTGVVAGAASRGDGHLRRMRARLTGEDPDALAGIGKGRAA